MYIYLCVTTPSHTHQHTTALHKEYAWATSGLHSNADRMEAAVNARRDTWAEDAAQEREERVSLLLRRCEGLAVLRDGLRNAVRVADMLYNKADELDSLEMMADVSRALATLSASSHVLDDVEGMRRLTYVPEDVITQEKTSKGEDSHRGSTAVPRQTRLFAFGGSDGVSDLKTAEVTRDGIAAEWQSLGSMLQKRRSAGCAAVAGMCFLCFCV
jgi:hypothetical protein